MKKETLWESKPSQLINSFKYLYVVLAFFLLTAAFNELNVTMGSTLLTSMVLTFVASFAIVYIYLRTATTHYQQTDKRILEKYGILNTTMESIELFRIKDVTVLRPFHIRIFGLSNIRIDSSDITSPVTYLLGIRNGDEIAEQLKELVIAERKRHGVREFD